VLLIADGENVTVGKPYVDGARVMATVKKNGKGDKIIVFKYKAKVRYRRKKGHRQLLTSLNIDKILPPGVEEEKPVKKTPPKPAAEAVKPVKKTLRKPTAEAVKTVKRTRRKKTEEKADGT
jgi:large subunit ribosomal protein L21